MTTDTNEVLETHGIIMRTLARQNVEVYFAVVGGQHQCCLSFDNRVLFEDSDVDKLPYTFHLWCDESSVKAVGRRMSIF